MAAVDAPAALASVSGSSKVRALELPLSVPERTLELPFGGSVAFFCRSNVNTTNGSGGSPAFRFTVPSRLDNTRSR